MFYMQVKAKALGLILLLLICMLVPSYRASATVSVITGFVSERKTPFILFDQLGHLVSIEDERFYVLGVGHVVRK